MLCVPCSKTLRFFVALQRGIRSVAKPPANRFPKLLKGGKVVTLDNDLGDLIGSADEFAEINKNLKKMFSHPEDTQSEEEIHFEEDYSSVYENPHNAFSHVDMDEKMRQKIIRKKMIKKNYFPDPKETNLLTYAAKKQIRHLHQLSPSEWTPEKLSQCFPISVSGVKRLLKNNHELRDEEQIRLHDQEVKRRWEILKSNKNLSEICPETVKLWRAGKLVKDFYSGNINLPLPPSPPTIEQEKRKKPGEHVRIIKKYLDAKRKQELEMKKITDSENSLTKTQPRSSENNIVNSPHDVKEIMPKFSFKYPRKSEIEDPESASFLATDKQIGSSSDVEMLSSEYKDNLVKELESVEKRNPIEEKYLEWLSEDSENVDNRSACEPYNPKDFFLPVKKSNRENIELMKENDHKNEVVYLYDAASGYQFPMGREIIKLHVKIPPQLYKKGSLYRVGKCFYDDTGEFLYKVPIIENEN